MSQQLLRRSVLVGLALLLAFVAISAVPSASTPVQSSNEFVLKPPPFVGIAQAQENPEAFPQDEAGISAYFRAPFSITIASVRPAFRTIEYEDSNYIIGSVAVPEYPESQDVHVYVHRDGWFLAYYQAADPAGKIIDWRVYQANGHTVLYTKLESALSVAALPAGISPSGVSFYDFRYPNANRMLFVADWVHSSSDQFQVNLPSDFAYFERSWSHTAEWYGEFKLNGQRVALAAGSWAMLYGSFSSVQLPPSQYNVFDVSSWGGNSGHVYGGLVLIYRVP